jgi:HK97 family phage portal protein
VARFLPALRSKALPAPVPVVHRGPMTEAKAILGDYYNALAQTNHFGLGVYGSARSWNVERAVVEGYERVVWVFKSVEAVSGNHSRLPFRLRQGEDIDEGHPMVKLLNHGKANPLETGRQFRKRLSAQILLSKAGAFVERTKSRGGTILRYDLLPPGRTLIVPPREGPDLVEYYEVTALDGSRRQLEPDKVIWFREPHPLDPYSGVTPLEAAGLSIELDFFARLYNVSFMRNDGRPGGILGVKGEMEDTEMDRVESRFGKGPVEAGKLSVINGELSYIDIAARPRDMQYVALAHNSKIEILVAFGTPESIIGNASGKTFDNAAQEEENFWTVTMPSHNDLIVSGFDEDSDDDLVGELDVSKVQALARVEERRRQEAREEVDKGLRSIDEYRPLAQLPVLDNPFTRALYLPSGRDPIPAREEDAEALGLGAPTSAAPPAVQGAPGEPPAVEETPGGPPALLPGTEAPGAEFGAAEDNPAEIGAGAPPPQGVRVNQPPGRTPAQALAAARSGPAITSGKALLPPARSDRRHRVTLRVIPGGAETKAAPEGGDDDEETEGAGIVAALEAALAAALLAVAQRHNARARARVQSPRVRKGTRHFAAEYDTDTRVGDRALDAAYAVDEATWAVEAAEATQPLVENAATVAALAALVALGGDDDDTGTLPAWAAVAVAAAVAEVVAFITASAARQALGLVTLINDLDQDNAELAEIVDAILEQEAAGANWASGLATHAATATVNGAADAAAGGYSAHANVGILRLWRARMDERTRPTHRAANGQLQPFGNPFVVGTALLRYPGDPFGPMRETAGCRCLIALRADGVPIPQRPETVTVRGGLPQAALP